AEAKTGVTCTLPGPNIAEVLSAAWMLAARLSALGDHTIGCVRSVVRLPNDSVNVPLVIALLNVSRCTSLVGRRELGAEPTTPVTWPAVVMLIGAAGRFCSALPKMIWNGPPGVPTTETLPLRSGRALSWF